MLISYLPSGAVKLFPYNTERTEDINSNVFNETNITNIIKSITDKSSYIIEYDETSKSMSFVIDGYYFEVNLTDLDLSKNLYAGITVANSMLSGGDLKKDDSESSEFTGLGFFTEKQDATEFTHTLHLFENGNPVKTSFLKFNADSLHIDVIQCSL